MTVEIAFLEKSHRQLCENMTIAERKLGATVAERLKRRLADLRAATGIKDILVGKPRTLGNGRQQQIALDLCEGYCLIFCSNHNPPPLLASGEIDWLLVSRIKILRIGRHYG